jgi:hypothetical protein
MYNRSKFSLICLFFCILFSANLYSAKAADAADLSSVIRILQISVGLNVSPQTADDANGDNKIGLEDAIYILQIAAGLRDDDIWKSNLGTINLGTTITYTGAGISVSGTTVTITAGGDHTVTGTLTDGMIVVNTTEKVKLRLSGVNITNKSGPAIFISNADKAFITLVENTVNYLTDGTSYSIEAKGTLFSNDSLEIKGSGTLYVTGNYKHAIACDDDILIENGTVIIEKSVKDGIHANSKIAVEGGNITITSSSDGIESEGSIVVKAGTVGISAGGDGLVAATDLTISGGNIGSTAAGDALKSRGTLNINGGITVASGEGVSKKGVSCSSTFIISSGILLASGGANSIPSDSSTQYSVILGSAAADSLLNVRQDKTDILVFKASKAYQAMLFSSPSLEAKKSYTVYTGGIISGGTDFYGLYTGASYDGGSSSVTFITDSLITDASTL